MRAYTLVPHWAHSVAWLGKGIENRTKPIPPALVGERVAIHAGATLPKGWFFEVLDAAPKGTGITSWGGLDGITDHAKLSTTDGDPPPIATRAIVATAVLGWCRESVAGLPRPPRWADPEAAWWWRLDDVRRLTTPIPCLRGNLGPWHLDRKYPGLTAQVEAASWVAA